MAIPEIVDFKFPLPSLEPRLGAAAQWLEQQISDRGCLDRIATALSLIQARGALSLLGVRFVAAGFASGTGHFAQCYVECQIPDRDNPGRAPLIGLAQDFTIRLGASAYQIIHDVQMATARLLAHELAEGINVGGIRPFEPHMVPSYSFDIGFGQ